jgi:immune inhibitor A
MKVGNYHVLALLLFVTLCLLFACQPGWPVSPLVDLSLSSLRPTQSAAQLGGSTTLVTATEHSLAQINVPANDLRDLAVRLRPAVDAVPLVVNSTTPVYTVGDQINFWVVNVNTREASEITAELIHKTAIAYAWVEVGPSANRTTIVRTVDRFSTQTYPAIVAFFGSEWKPGVDHDPRLHILYTTGLGGPAGYFGQADEYSRLVNPYSNEKELVYISLTELGNGALLAHEFQHMLHWQHDRNEATWVEEGLSEYAQEVAGIGTTSAFVSDFLMQPDTPLTAWEEGTPNHYGASYLFMKYLHQRFGPGLLRTLVAQPGDGMAGIQQALVQRGIPEEFDALFADWVVANYANQPTALGQAGLYGYVDLPFRQPSTISLKATSPITAYQATVHNYATDYLRIQGEGAITVHFAGQPTMQLANLSAASGRSMWWSNQGDRSDSRLTRAFDLRSVTPGRPLILEVTMWWDIEAHYDYGYVLASRDGRKWEILAGQQTTTDNPTGNSFGPAYTGEPLGSGQAERWVVERFDLSRYAGEQIWLRFEYVTDDAINHVGWFIDDIRIPAIDYATNFEQGPDGWVSEGWLLTDNQLTQRWLLQVLEFEDDVLVKLHRIPVAATGRAQVELTNLSASQEAVLAISALTLGPTAPGQYELTLHQSADQSP